MEEIIINGISLNVLSTQLNSIRQEASRLISDNIALAQDLTRQLIQKESKEEIEQIASKAYEALKTANFISNVTGIQCDVPYNSSYTGDYDEDTLSALLENSENEIVNEILYKNEDLKNLMNLAYDLEYQSKQWNSSSC